jgi:hypothetical protein
MKKIILMVGVLVCAWGVAPGIAQTEAEEKVETVAGFSYGQVVSISSNKIIVREYDFDNEEGVQVTYVINSETEFVNVGSYNELQNGDDVEISYKNVGEEKIATAISKEVQWNLEDDFNYEEGQGGEDSQEEYQEKEYGKDPEDADRG